MPIIPSSAHGMHGAAMPQPAVRHETVQTQPRPGTAASATPQDKLGAFQASEMAADSDVGADAAHRAKSNPGKHVRQEKKSQSYEQLRRMPQQRLRRVFDAMEGHTGNERNAELELNSSAEDLLAAFDSGNFDEAADALHKDPLRRYVILCTAAHMLRTQLGNEAAQGNTAGQDSLRANLVRLDAAIDKLLRANGKRIRGGFNTAQALEFFSNEVEERDKLRDVYYDTIVTGRSVRETFERLLKAFGPSRFRNCVKTLRNAIVDDMKAPFPSSNRILLEAYYQGLKETHVLLSMIRATSELEQKIGPTALKSDQGVVDFLTQVLHYTDGPGTARQLNQICEAVAGTEYKEMLADESLSRHVKQFLLKHIPIDVWSDDGIRDTVLAPHRQTVKAAPAT
jgi:type III secretion system YopN/LcrE/InvE/MxiC family regulator